MSSEVDRLKAQAELVWRRCAADKLYFFRNFWHIKHPKGSRLFDPREPQLHAAEVWGQGSNSITLKARQIGWSTLVAADTFWEAFFNPEYQAMLLSKGEREATQLLSQLKYGYNRLPKWMQERGPALLDNNQLRMTFSNESVVLSLPSSNNPARGYTGNRVVCDEFAFLSNPEESWAAIEPVADIGGQLILLSTANGYGNTFHEQWTRAVLGESDFEPMFYGWWAVPERDEAWYERKRGAMPEWQLAQEYPDNPDEAFVKSGNMVFDYDLLSKMVAAEPKLIGDMVGGKFVEQPNGPLAIFELPEPGADYVVSADTAEGLAHGDYSSTDVLTPDGVQVAHWHGKMGTRLVRGGGRGFVPLVQRCVGDARGELDRLCDDRFYPLNARSRVPSSDGEHDFHGFHETMGFPHVPCHKAFDHFPAWAGVARGHGHSIGSNDRRAQAVHP